MNHIWRVGILFHVIWWVSRVHPYRIRRVRRFVQIGPLWMYFYGWEKNPVQGGRYKYWSVI